MFNTQTKGIMRTICNAKCEYDSGIEHMKQSLERRWTQCAPPHIFRQFEPTLDEDERLNYRRKRVYTLGIHTTINFRRLYISLG